MTGVRTDKRGGLPAVAGHRGPLLASAILSGLTVALLPFVGHRLGPTISFVPAMLAAVAAFDVMSVWLLAGEYLDTGERRYLLMSAAYLWSLVLMTAYALAFPGVFAVHPPFAITTSVAPYFYVSWHTGFPALLGLAWGPWSRDKQVDSSLSERRRRVAVALASTVAGASALVVGILTQIRHLPVVIHGLDTSAMARVTAPFALPIVVMALVLAGRGVRGRGGPERWAFVAILACLCDLTLTYCSRYRYSVGWYAGRSMTIASAGVVLVAMLGSFRRLKATAEVNAAYDHLTGLPNRRTAYDALPGMQEAARRCAGSLAVVMFDLDRFKAVNDEHGHAVGDAVLRLIGPAARTALRSTDVVARIGGEEFLVLLPDVCEEEAMLVAERIRLALRAIDPTPTGKVITASFGVASMWLGDADAEALIRRADNAMYTAKLLGRDRCSLSPQTPEAAGGLSLAAG